MPHQITSILSTSISASSTALSSLPTQSSPIGRRLSSVSVLWRVLWREFCIGPRTSSAPTCVLCLSLYYALCSSYVQLTPAFCPTLPLMFSLWISYPFLRHRWMPTLRLSLYRSRLENFYMTLLHTS